MATLLSLGSLFIACYLLLLNGSETQGMSPYKRASDNKLLHPQAKTEKEGTWHSIYIRKSASDLPPPPISELQALLGQHSQKNNRETPASSNPFQSNTDSNLQANNQQTNPNNPIQDQEVKTSGPTIQDKPQPPSIEKTDLAPQNTEDSDKLFKEIAGTAGIMQNRYRNFDSISSITMLGVLTALYDLVKPESESFSKLKDYFRLKRDMYTLDSLKVLKKNLLKNDFHFGSIFHRGTNTGGNTAELKSQLEKSDTVVLNSIDEYVYYAQNIPRKLFTRLTKTDNEYSQTLGSFISYKYTWGNLKTSTAQNIFRVNTKDYQGATYAKFIDLSGKFKVYESESETVVKIPLQKVSAGQQVENNGEISLLLIRTNVDYLRIKDFRSILTSLSQVQEKDNKVSFPRFSFYDVRIMNEKTFPQLLKSGNQDLPLLGTFNEGKISSSSGGCVTEKGVSGFGYSKFEVGQSVDERNEVQSKYEMDKSDIGIKGLVFDQGFYFVLTAESTNAPLAVTYVKPSSVNEKSKVDCQD
ncbi:hypothetical protein HMI54_012560 [Coelomomyces lativittatus]|nr:hypothetical protein HMI56_003291 [Coelomomyces lativittatus]KAJ1517530.1 hypothetical protein HMI55_006793 [Coelomomyces lativittatus]KAJ1518676.1 hypothetical protein HMI54_012560 [Coelomomyces lativittatus]